MSQGTRISIAILLVAMLLFVVGRRPENGRKSIAERFLRNLSNKWAPDAETFRSRWPYRWFVDGKSEITAVGISVPSDVPPGTPDEFEPDSTVESEPRSGEMESSGQ